MAFLLPEGNDDRKRSVEPDVLAEITGPGCGRRVLRGQDGVSDKRHIVLPGLAAGA